MGDILIGRSANCNLTIDDPLVSRSHARIVITETGAFIEDAGSRNGIRVDGRTIRARTPLRDGSRVRLGTQEVLLRVIEKATSQPPRRRATGFMIHCKVCGVPHSTDALVCPNCGDSPAESGEEEPTTTTEQAWSIELLAETMHRAQALGRKDDIERLLIQARGVMESNSVTIDRRRIDQLADSAIRFAREGDRLEWARWALSLYARRGIAPGLEISQQISSLSPEARDTLAPAFSDVLMSLRPHAAGGEVVDEETMNLLRQLSRLSGN